MTETAGIQQTLTGTVVSNRMDKTIAVLVERSVKHPLYEKYVRKSRKFLAHDEKNECREGDVVVIESTRPISRRKAWRLRKIVERAQEV